MIASFQPDVFANIHSLIQFNLLETLKKTILADDLTFTEVKIFSVEDVGFGNRRKISQIIIIFFFFI
jgi:hypothetical protein